MKNTKTNKVIRRTAGLALSAVMLMSVAGTTLCSATAEEATVPAQTQSLNGISGIDRMDELKSHDGRVLTPGTSNWFAVRNTADGKMTYITASGNDGVTTIEVIKVVNEESVVVSSTTADLAQGEMRVEIPMDEEDGYMYFINVYQNPETASTNNYSINHLSQGYINMLDATTAEYGKINKVKSQTATVENMDGSKTEINCVQDTFYCAAGAETSYCFEIFADNTLDYSYVVTDFDGNIVADGQDTAYNGYSQEISIELEENGCYFVYLFGTLAEEGEAGFIFGSKC